MALWETARSKSCHVLSATPLQIPYFNAPIFLENKTQVGKVEEIFGQINNVVSRGARPQDHSMGLLQCVLCCPGYAAVCLPMLRFIEDRRMDVTVLSAM